MIKYIVLLLLSFNLFAEELESLLSTYAHKSDLSEKTKHENSGMSIVYTRSDLEKMQARTLKDVLKSFPITSYQETRYAYSDMITSSQRLPFHSSIVRVFIDDIEITSASKGSGFSIMGDTDLEFVDHIEIYSLNPSFEFSSEPVLVLVKLYTKVAQRDRGGKVALSVGSRGYDKQSAYYTNTIDDWAYFLYASNLDDKRERVQSLGKEINKDKTQQNYLLKLSNDDHKLLLQGDMTSRHLSANMSSDLTPLDTSVIDYERHSFGYVYKGIDNLKFLFSYEMYDSEMFLEDDNPFPIPPYNISSMRLDSKEKVLSTELTYKFKTDSNVLLLGAKYRDKSFVYSNFELSGIPRTPSAYNNQNIAGLFAENRYQLASNSIVTLGFQYNRYDNNGGVEDENIRLLRVGHTYTNQDWVFKLYGYTMEIPTEAYMHNSVFARGITLKKQTNLALTQETKYQIGKDKVRFVFNYMTVEDLLGTDPDTSQLAILDKPTSFYSVISEYTHTFDEDNKLILMGSYNLIDTSYTDNEIEYNAYVKFFNTYKNIDLYNELIYYYYTAEQSHKFDLNIGASYAYSDDIKIELKGENILGKAYTDRYYRLDGSGTYLDMTPFDRRVYLNVEYLF